MLIPQGSNLFYFRDDISRATQVKGVLCLDSAVISAKPALYEVSDADTDRYCIIVRLDPKNAEVAKHHVYTFSAETAKAQVTTG